MTTFLVEHPHARRTDLQLRGERVEPLAFCPAIHWCGSNGSSATASNSLIRVTAWSWRRVSDQVVTLGLLEGRVTRGCAIRSSRASRASWEMVLPSRAATAAARSRRVAATRNAICGEVAVPDREGRPVARRTCSTMSSATSGVSRVPYARRVPDTPPRHRDFLRPGLTEHSATRPTSANANCFKVGCTVPG